MPTLWVALVAFGSLLLSSVAGYGGSLMLVPVLAATLGAKEGIALAALMLAVNNVCKVVAYRGSLGLRKGWPLLPVSLVGALLGGLLLVELPRTAVVWALVVVTAASLAIELAGPGWLLHQQPRMAVPLLGASSVLSGVSGSSGPLKGIAIRSLRLGRMEHVGLASCVSLVADATKTEVFRRSGILAGVDLSILLVCLPAMPVAALVGQRVNLHIGESTFRAVFWVVVCGYLARVVIGW